MLDQLGTEGLDRVKEKAKEAGALLSDQTAHQAKQFADSLDDLKKSAHDAVAQGIDAMLPELQNLVDLAKDPEAQQGLQAIGEGIAAIGVQAGKAIIGLGEFIKSAREILAFHLDETIQGDQGYLAALNRADAIRSEQARRKQAPLGAYGALIGRTKEVLAPFNPLLLSPTANAEAIQNASLARKSDAELNAELAKLETEMSVHLADTKKAQAAAAKAQGQAMDNAAGSVIDDIWGDNKKPRAPIVNPLGSGADNTKELAAAFARLQDQLATLRTQGLDPTAAAWAQYNKTVADATETAKKAGNTPEALDTLKAIQTEATRIRDAQIDKIAEQDRQAWEALKRSFETPAQVAVDDALKKIAQLNDQLKKVPLSSAEYHDALAKIGAASVTNAPQYQGPDAAVGGAFGELQKNSEALADLEAWHQSVLDANASFHAKSAAEEEAYQSRMKTIEQTYSTQRVAIEKARGMLTLQASEEAFGQLAALTNSKNHTLAVIGRSAAIMQAGLSLAINVAKASEVGFPLNIGFIAGAIAQGAQIVELIDEAGDGSGGYADGGYTGAGSKYKIAGVVHAEEHVSRREVVRQPGARAFLDDFNRVGMAALAMHYPGYADGGFVHPLSNAPSPAELGFETPEMFNIESILGTPAENVNTQQQALVVKPVILLDKEDLAEEILNTRNGERLTVHHVGNNPRAVQAKWQR